MNIKHGIIFTQAVVIAIMAASILQLKGDLAQSERNFHLVTRHLDNWDGGTTILTGEWINYSLRTFDSGKHWYAIEHDDDWGVIILGEAEEIYPGLLKHLRAWDKLTDPELKPTRSEKIALLRDVGFTVEIKE